MWNHRIVMDIGHNRREVLKAGVLGSLFLSLTLFPRQSRGAPTTSRGPFGAFTEPHQRRILRAVAGEALAGFMPVESGARAQALDIVIAGCDGYMARMPLPVQNEAREALDLLDISLARWLLGGPWADWETAAGEDVAGFLEGLRTSRFALKRNLYQFLHDMGHIGWFGDPAAWSALGYPGPPRLPRPSGENPL